MSLYRIYAMYFAQEFHYIGQLRSIFISPVDGGTSDRPRVIFFFWIISDVSERDVITGSSIGKDCRYPTDEFVGGVRIAVRIETKLKKKWEKVNTFYPVLR